MDPCMGEGDLDLDFFDDLWSDKQGHLSSTHTSSSSILTDYSPSNYSDSSSLAPRTCSYTSLESQTINNQSDWPFPSSKAQSVHRHGPENSDVRFYFEEPTSPTNSTHNTDSSHVQDPRGPVECPTCAKSFPRQCELK